MKEFNQKQMDLIVFVNEAHKGQTRKYNGKAYATHPIKVAKMVMELDLDHAVEAALLHDVVEDTDFTIHDVRAVLKEIGYIKEDRMNICTYVKWLTNRYTKEKYPKMNRTQRKMYEADRLNNAPADVQTIKCLDIAHNTLNLADEDPGFAKIYIPERINMVDNCRKADVRAIVLACGAIYTAQNKLNKIIAIDHMSSRFSRVAKLERRQSEIENMRKEGVIMQLIKDGLVEDAIKIRLGW